MSNSHKIHVEFPGRILFVGFGSIGQGVLPLCCATSASRPSASPSSPPRTRASEEARQVRHQVRQGAPDARELPPRAQSAARARRFPDQRLGRGLEHRAHQAVLGEGRDVPRHLHRAVAGRLHRPDRAGRPGAPTTRCARRRWRCAPATRAPRPRCSPTAPIPGLVSHFVKQALLNIAADTQVDAGNPGSRAEWGELARRLGVKVDAHRRARHAGRRTSPSSRASSSTPGRSTAS